MQSVRRALMLGAPLWMCIAMLNIGCTFPEHHAASSKPALVRVVLKPPVTFAGVIPCADCPGQRLTVSLRPDGIFLLRHTYVSVAAGKDEQFHDLGRWAISEDGMRLILRGGTEAPRQFALKDARTLRMLTNEGKEIQSQLNYDLTRTELYDPIEDTLRLRGMFVYLADAASLTECLTGQRFPIAQEKDYLALEKAYVTMRRAPGEFILVTMEGHLTRRPIGEGDALKDVIVVDRFDRLWPGETCARQALSRASLTNTYWRPVEIVGKPVTVGAGQREPHLVLVSAESTVRGFGGCNQMHGRYEVDGSSLRFVGMATTRMFCQDTMEQERALLQAIESTTSYKIIGETLELYDPAGKLLARCESRYMR